GSGADLLDWIRGNRDDEIRFLPVIVISAYTTERVVSMARDRGANEALVKPVSGMKLAQRILATIDNPRPFISGGGFFGPDRRRQVMPFTQERRITKIDSLKVSHEQL
ncbi:MAG TPA: response regulator, partial [Alphaproteobacteria bacterium]|nr:response regulator [Alphaproteobacteria bacterium]